MAVALFPIIFCLHLTHQTVAVPAARAPAQITTRQLIELFFSSQAGGHCKNIPTLEYGFLVQVRHQPHMSDYCCTHAPAPASASRAVPNMTNGCMQSQRELGFIARPPPSCHRGALTGDAAVISFQQIMKYSEQRIPTLNEYCVVCDEQHVFQNGSMLKVTRTMSDSAYYTDTAAHDGDAITNNSLAAFLRLRLLIEI